jgi:taurine dioxygenase
MTNIRVVGDQIGVEVSGVDVKTMNDADFAEIYQAWIDHNVLAVTGQELAI